MSLDLPTGFLWSTSIPLEMCMKWNLKAKFIFAARVDIVNAPFWAILAHETLNDGWYYDNYDDQEFLLNFGMCGMRDATNLAAYVAMYV